MAWPLTNLPPETWSCRYICQAALYTDSTLPWARVARAEEVDR